MTDHVNSVCKVQKQLRRGGHWQNEKEDQDGLFGQLKKKCGKICVELEFLEKKQTNKQMNKNPKNRKPNAVLVRVWKALKP